MLRAFVIILLFLFIGEGIQTMVSLSIPGNVIGMVLIFVGLQAKLIKLEWVKPASDSLTRYLALFFVPPGVGLLLHLSLLSQYGIPILLTVGISFLITLASTAYVFHLSQKPK
ncbi:MAG: CidA/LrgA family protein [Bacteroidota bacterium]